MWLSPGSYDATVRAWDCRARTYDPVQVMDEAKDSVTSLQFSASEILTGSVLMYCQWLWTYWLGNLVPRLLGNGATGWVNFNCGLLEWTWSYFTSVQLMEKWEGTTSDLASCSVTPLDVRHPPSTSTITMFTEKLILCDLSSSEPVTSVSFSRDGHCILASSLDDRLRLLDKDNGELLNKWVSAHERDWLLPSGWRNLPL